MTAKTFGRRGLPAGGAVPVQTAQAPVRTEASAASAQPDEMAGSRDLAAMIPVLTVGIIFFLFFVFFLQKATALDIGPGGAMSIESLIAQGGISYDLVFGQGEVWRIFLGPILHADAGHLLGNCIALMFVGWRLEPWISRGWLAAIFAVSGLGGVIGSLIANPHSIVGIGASGAITGLIGALFVMSFLCRAEAQDQTSMRRMAMFFGVPALLPLLIGASDGVDYAAHLGGAIAGGAIGWALSDIWSDGRGHTLHSGVAAKIAGAALACSLLASGFAAMGYAAHAARAAELVPLKAMPKDAAKMDEDAFVLLSHYSKDPQAHIYRGIYLMIRRSFAAAETELVMAIMLEEAREGNGRTSQVARYVLAVVYDEQGRKAAAREAAREPCEDKAKKGMREDMVKRHLCT